MRVYVHVLYFLAAFNAHTYIYSSAAIAQWSIKLQTNLVNFLWAKKFAIIILNSFHAQLIALRSCLYLILLFKF